jgi:hypothetical protein
MRAVNEEFASKPRSDLAVEFIDKDLVVLDKLHGQIHQFNETASFIWSAIADGDSLSTIASNLVERFDVSPGTAKADIETVVLQFESLKLLQSENQATGKT